MSRGYGKYRRGSYHNASFQFENLFKENSNRPSAARSTGTVGKWGITSFTSIRTINGEQAGLSLSCDGKSNGSSVRAENALPKPKKFFKSRNTESTESEQHYSDKEYAYTTSSSKKPKLEKSPKAKRFFTSKQIAVVENTILTANVNNAKRGGGGEKPPIVLRIYRGKSQLVNDSSGDSESTPTPSSVPSTSTVTSPRRSPSARITRSTRRSMQQDPAGSPATGDTAGGDTFSLFTSPKKDQSPQYIPAEKYELERKAMYANLLGTPMDEAPSGDEGGHAVIDLPSADDNAVDENKIRDPRALIEEDDLDDVDEAPEPAEEPDPEPKVQETVEEENEEEEEEEERDVAAALEELEVLAEEGEGDDKNDGDQAKLAEDWSGSESDSNEPEPEPEPPAPAPPSPPPQRETRSRKSPNKPKTTSSTIDEHKDEILDKILEKPENPAPVKLLISKKKGSIFKSRSLVDGGSKKRRAIYRHKWADEKEKQPPPEPGAEAQPPAVASPYEEDFGFKDDPLTMVEKEEEDAVVTSVKCTRNDKGFYTVVRNVKKAHQMQEIGEFQEFNDDVEYILDALQDNNPISTRCLSAISLATKCMAPAFRMHVRAHGTVAKFFKALHDATKDQSLGLCTATVMFVLSQDRLNMDLDRDCLELMLNLLESDVGYQQALDVSGLSSAQLEKNKQKVREICAEIQSQGHAMHLNLDNITVGQLVMETLLSLTSKRAGEWFKEELRELGGLEHIMKTICECCRQVSDYVVSWTDVLLDKLRKVDRCLRVLENVTHNNEENQTYLLKYDNGILLDTLVKLYRLCDSEIPLYPVTDIGDKESAGAVIREALLVTLKVLINLTHHFNKQSLGSTLIGARPGIVDASLHLLLQVPHYIPDQKKFELGVLVLMLLINLIQDNENNKLLLIGAKAPAEFESIFPCDKTAVEALIVQFHQWEECAHMAEKRTDAILDGEKDTGAATPQHKSNEEFIEETVAKLLQKAGTHMEFTFLASYLVLLLGYLIMDNVEYQNLVRQFVKDNNFSMMVDLLKKFFNFMNLTATTEASSVCAIKATEKVIKFLEECDKPTDVEGGKSGAPPPYRECMDLSFSITH